MPNDPKADWYRYIDAMGDHDFDRGLAICAEIEKRYGLYGETPQTVTSALLDLHHQQPQQQEPPPNVQNPKT